MLSDILVEIWTLIIWSYCDIMHNANSIFDIFQGDEGGRGCSRVGEGEGEDFSLATAFFYCLSLATTVGQFLTKLDL